jgi:hypothetical protein
MLKFNIKLQKHIEKSHTKKPTAPTSSPLITPENPEKALIPPTSTPTSPPTFNYHLSTFRNSANLFSTFHAQNPGEGHCHPFANNLKKINRISSVSTFYSYKTEGLASNTHCGP